MNFNPATPLVVMLCIIALAVAWDYARRTK